MFIIQKTKSLLFMHAIIPLLFHPNFIIILELFAEPFHVFLVVIEDILPPVAGVESANVNLMPIHGFHLSMPDCRPFADLELM